MNRSSRYRLNIALFLLPALLLFLVILIAPIFISLYDSLFSFRWFMDSERKFVGLQNYVTLFSRYLPNAETGASNLINTRYLGDALVTTLLLAALSVFIQLPLSLAVALRLGKGIHGERFYLTVFFMPVLISSVIIAEFWKKIYFPTENGILNTVLTSLGIRQKVFDLIGGGFTGDWTANARTGMVAAFIPVLWQYIGYHMLLMYAGIKGVPNDLIEAARLDGAREGQINRYIIIPYIKPILRVSVIFAVTGSLKSYDLFYAFSMGNNKPVVIVPSMMLQARITDKNMGMASAIATILIILCFAFALLINLAFRNKGDKVA